MRALNRLFLLLALTLCAPAPGATDESPFAGIDRQAVPGADFFAYANGAWLKQVEIPADRSSYGIFDQLEEVSDQRTAELIRTAGEGHPPAGSDARKIADTYTTFMDEAAIEAKGLAPVKGMLDRIAAISDRAGLARYLGGTVRADVDVLNATSLWTPNLFGLWVAQDLDDPSRYSPFLLQGGLDMPERDYYLDPTPKMVEIRTAWQAHVEAVLKLSGLPDPAVRAARVVALERRIAEVHATRLETEDVQMGNNHWRRADFPQKAPGLDWGAFFQAAGLGRQAMLVVWQPGAVTGIAVLVGSEPMDAWKDYLAFHAVDDASAWLPKAFVDERFSFHGKILTGTPQLRDRWKRAVEVTNQALGEAVGRLYVARWFPAAEKARAERMVRMLVAAFGQRIDALDWMSPETKAKAKAKLATLKVGVGYPDRWRDYSALKVVAGDALGNAQRAELFELKRNLAKLGRPIDRDEWVMTPQTVNAVNLPVMNALNFPAAILQPPYFDPKRTAAMNYGATGATIGHEISHSFDDQGALFDATGRLKNWWTTQDFAHFEASGAALVKQYDAYRPFPDLAVKGRQTLSENIADLAGLAAAFDAFRLSLGNDPAPVVEGFTGEQQFFLAFAQSWRTRAREAALRRQVMTNGHAPAEYRGDTVRNLDAWYPAFDVKPGQGLYLAPDQRVKVW